MIEIGPTLLICPEEESRYAVAGSLRKCGVHPLSCSTYIEARRLMQQHNFSVVLCSDRLADGGYQSVIAAAKPIPVVVLSSLAEWEPYLAALRAGAFDYIACPPDPSEVERILWSAINEGSRTYRKAASAA